MTDNGYDYRDRLVAVRNYSSGTLADRSEYRYDPLSRPVKKIATLAGQTSTTELVYLGISDAVVRETESGATSATRSYGFDALGDRLTLTENGSRFSYAIDPRDSVEAVLDQTNNVRAAYGYLAYGEANPTITNTASSFNANSNLYRYTGKRFDPAAKAYDMGARHYFPAQAHWFQQDTYTNALANLGLSTDPLNSNRYLFTGANPVNYIELDGHVFGSAQQYDGGSNSCLRWPHCHREPTGDAGAIAAAFWELSGGADLVNCVQGSATDCAMFAAGFTPVGKAKKFAKLAAESPKLATATRLVEEAGSQTASSKTLRKNLGEEGGYAHHIVAWGDGRADVSKKILIGHGIGPNGAINGVIVTKAGNHPTVYYEAIERRLIEAIARAPKGNWLAQRGEIIAELRKIKRDIKMGALGT